MQNLLVEVSHQDQIFVEDECTKHGHSISSFFVLLLEEYKESRTAKKPKEEKVDVKQEEIAHTKEKAPTIEKEADSTKEEKPKRGRKKRS